MKKLSSWLVKFYRDHTWGDFFDASDVKPKTANKYDCVVLAINDGTGLQMIDWVKLPHQIYRKDLNEVLKRHPMTKEIVAIPIHREDYITLWHDKDYQ